MTLAFERYFVRRLSLDIKKPKDLELFRYVSLTYSNIFGRIGEAAKDNRTLDRGDWYWIADKVLKARKAYTFWEGPSPAQATAAVKLLVQVCQALVKEYR